MLLGYLLINIIFNYPVFWGEMLNDSSRGGAVIGEIAATEWGMEQVYHRLMNLKNPFRSLDVVFYPFDVDVSTADIGLGFHFLYLRPFLSPHQALSLLVTLNFFLANICMYALLRKLGLRRLVSFLIGLAYGYMTFMTVRLGHLTYSFYYLFPLFYWSYLNFFTAKNSKDKIIFTVTTSLILVFTMWQHMYYFIMLLISIATLGLYHLISNTKKTINVVRDNFWYLVLSMVVIFVVLTPWLRAFYETFLFSESQKFVGWGGAIGYSSDLLGFFIPSGYNYYYGRLVDLLINKLDIVFAKGIFENFTYPGLIILFGYMLLSIQVVRRRLRSWGWLKIRGYFIASMVFLILTLGPFLHVAGRWFVELDEGIKVYIPLPYILLRYIPFLGNIRSPGRFIVGFIFFAYIVVGFLLSHILRNRSKKFLFITTVLFLIVFFLDHRYPNQKLSTPFYFPKQIYREIAKDKSKSSVIEIPFTARDGFTYFGDEGAIYQITGQFTYDKPLIGGYVGRVPDYIKDYYENNAFIGYVGRLIDENVALNGSIDRNDLGRWRVMDQKEAKRAIDFLSIKHIILNADRPYATTLSAELNKVGYREKLRERNYLLLERSISKSDFLEINMGENKSNLQLGMGWFIQSGESFKLAGKRTSILFKVQNPKKSKLIFTVSSFSKLSQARVYVNKKEVGTIAIAPTMKTYTLDVPFRLKQGINKVYFVFNKAYRQSDVIPGSRSQRELAAKFYSIRLAQ